MAIPGRLASGQGHALDRQATGRSSSGSQNKALLQKARQILKEVPLINDVHTDTEKTTGAFKP